jgi:hypothetical protein
MNDKHPNSSPSNPRNELEGSLRRAVERMCHHPIPQESLERALQRAERVQASEGNRRRRLSGILTLVGVAAALLAAVGIWFLRPSAGWAQVADALRSRPWIHATWKGLQGQQGEFWFSPERGVSARRQDRWVIYDDHRLGIRYSYEPEEQTLYRVPQDTQLTKREVSAFAEVFEKLLRGEAKLHSPLYGSEIVQQERRRVVIQDENWTEFDLTLRLHVQDELLRLVFRVPPGRRLPYSLKWTPLGEKAGESMEWVFEYPENGPVDAYALGVPRTSRVVDRVPPEDLGTVLHGAQVSRERFGPYHAIVVQYGGSDSPWNSLDIRLVWRKENRWRVELALANATIDNAEPPAPGVDPLAWWKRRLQKFHFVPVSACNGKAVYQVDFSPPDHTGKQQRTWKELWKVSPDQDAAGSVGQAGSVLPDLFAYPHLEIPSQQFEGRLDRAPKQGPADTVLLTAQATRYLGAYSYHQSRYWIDPLRSYVTIQHEFGDLRGPLANDAAMMEKETYIMERLEQTPGGVWYPTRVRRKNCAAREPGGKLDLDLVTWFYMDFKAEVPDSLFEPRDRER